MKLVKDLCEPDKIHYEPREVYCQPVWIYLDNSPAFDTFLDMVHNEPMELQEWLRTLPGAPTVSQAADHSHISKATLLRHAKTGKTTAEFAVTISRAYKVNEIDSLIALGFVTSEAVNGYGVKAALSSATNEQLLDEIMRRSDPQARYLFGNEGDEDTIGLAPHLTPVSDPSGSLHDDDDGVVREFDYEPSEYAADSSINEQEEREKRGEDLID